MDGLWLTVALLALSIVLIVKGGDFFVDAATWIAEVAGIPKFIIGATIVSLATTLPEIIVSLLSASQGKVDMAAGNAIGSVTVNIGIIMGISILFMPSVVKMSDFRNKALLMAAGCMVLLVFSLGGELTLPACAVSMLIFLLFMADNIRSAKLAQQNVTEEKPKSDKRTTIVNIIKFILGTAGIAGGAQLLVDNASILARLAGVPERIIAVTIVAIGTSLPELVTTITAISKKQSSLSIGNIVGANVIDLALILPLCAFISGGSLPVSQATYSFDLPVCLGIIAIAIIPVFIKKKFMRWQGVALVCGYLAYIVYSCVCMA